MSRFERAEVLRAVRAPRRVMFMSKLVEAGYRPMQAAEINAQSTWLWTWKRRRARPMTPIMCASAHRLFAPAMLKETN